MIQEITEGTVEHVIFKKGILETQINDLIFQFEKETKCKIRDINYSVIGIEQNELRIPIVKVIVEVG